MSENAHIVKLSDTQKKANLNPNGKIAPETFYVVDYKRYVDVFRYLNSRNSSTAYGISSNVFIDLTNEEAMNDLLNVYDTSRKLLSEEGLKKMTEALKDLQAIKEIKEDNIFVVKTNDIKNYNFCRKSEFEDILRSDIYASFADSFDYLSERKTDIHKTLSEDTIYKMAAYFNKDDSEKILDNIFYDYLLAQGFNKDVLHYTVLDFYRYNPSIIEQKTKIYLDTLLESNSLRAQLVKESLNKEPMDKNEFIDNVLQSIDNSNNKTLEVVKQSLNNILENVEKEDGKTILESLTIKLKNDLNNPINKKLYNRKDLNSNEKRLKIFDNETTIDNKSIEIILEENFGTDFQNEYKIMGKELKEILSKGLLGFNNEGDEYLFSRKSYDDIISEKSNYDEYTLELLNRVVYTLKEYEIKDKKEYSYSEFLTILRDCTNYRGSIDYLEGDFLGINEINNKESLYYSIDGVKKMFRERSLSGVGDTFEDSYKNFMSEIFQDYGFAVSRDDFNIRLLPDYEKFKTLETKVQELKNKEINADSLESLVEQLSTQNKELIDTYFGLSGSDMSMDYAIASLINNNKFRASKGLLDKHFYDFNSVSLFDLKKLMYEKENFDFKLKSDELFEANDFKFLAQQIVNNPEFKNTFIKEFMEDNSFITDFNNVEKVSNLIADMANSVSYFRKFDQYFNKLKEWDSHYKTKLNDLLIINERMSKKISIEDEIKSLTELKPLYVSNLYNYKPFREAFEKQFNRGKHIETLEKFQQRFKDITDSINLDDYNNLNRYKQFLENIKKIAQDNKIDNEYKALFPTKEEFNFFYKEIDLIKENDTLDAKKQLLREVNADLENYINLFVNSYNKQVPEWNESLKISGHSLTKFLTLNQEISLTYDSYKEQEKNKRMYFELNDIITEHNYNMIAINDRKIIKESLLTLYMCPELCDKFLQICNVDIPKDSDFVDVYKTFIGEFTTQLCSNNDGAWDLINKFKEEINNMKANDTDTFERILLDNNFKSEFLSLEKLFLNSDIRDRIVKTFNGSLGLADKIKTEKIDDFIKFYNDNYSKGTDCMLTKDSFIKLLSMEEAPFVSKKMELDFNSNNFEWSQNRWVHSLRQLSKLDEVKNDPELKSTVKSLIQTISETGKRTPLPSYSSVHSVGNMDFFMSILSQHTNSLHEFSKLQEMIKNEKAALDNKKSELLLEDGQIKALIDKKQLSNYTDAFTNNEKEILFGCIKESSNFNEFLKNIDSKLEHIVMCMRQDERISFFKDCSNIYNASWDYSCKLTPNLQQDENLHDLGTNTRSVNRPKGIVEMEGSLLEGNRKDFVYTPNSLKNTRLYGILTSEFKEHFRYDDIIKKLCEHPDYKIFCHKEIIDGVEKDVPNRASVVISERVNNNEIVYGLLLQSNTGEKMILTSEVINKDFSDGKNLLVDVEYFSGTKKQEIRQEDERSFGADNSNENTSKSFNRKNIREKEDIINEEPKEENNHKDNIGIDVVKEFENVKTADMANSGTRETSKEDEAFVDKADELAGLEDFM